MTPERAMWNEDVTINIMRRQLNSIKKWKDRAVLSWIITALLIIYILTTLAITN